MPWWNILQTFLSSGWSGGGHPRGESVVIETPAIGNTFPARTILACIPPGEAKILSVTGEQGPCNSPVAGLARDGPVPITRFAETQSR